MYKKNIKLLINWEGQNDLGLTLDRNYTKKYIDVSIPGYTLTALQTFQQKPPARPQDAPRSWNKPVYGKHIQLAVQKYICTKTQLHGHNSSTIHQRHLPVICS